MKLIFEQSNQIRWPGLMEWITTSCPCEFHADSAEIEPGVVTFVLVFGSLFSVRGALVGCISFKQKACSLWFLKGLVDLRLPFFSVCPSVCLSVCPSALYSYTRPLNVMWLALGIRDFSATVRDAGSCILQKTLVWVKFFAFLHNP